MKKTKSMRLAVLAAGLLCCSIFTVPAYAQSSEPQEETPPAETEAQPETQNPFSTCGAYSRGSPAEGTGRFPRHSWRTFP